MKRDSSLHKRNGKKVFEIRYNVNWHKGKAVSFLLEHIQKQTHSELFPIYIGDDTTDEDAFQTLAQLPHALSIHVCSSDSHINKQSTQTAATETGTSTATATSTSLANLTQQQQQQLQPSVDEECEGPEKGYLSSSAATHIVHSIDEVGKFLSLLLTIQT
eukprot:TRINITY_DN5637_c0_g1_i1.p1 TRINITY_DN5637_c0_g1~~TRINITY_DN5637_c0_g1_i1.p1  ORF type:complete len:179 (+),score=55.70 TRINITY_DN5637_c0_g1_i1:58-537(+)